MILVWRMCLGLGIRGSGFGTRGCRLGARIQMQSRDRLSPESRLRARCFTPRIHQRLRNPHGLGIGERLVQSAQADTSAPPMSRQGTCRGLPGSRIASRKCRDSLPQHPRISRCLRLMCWCALMVLGTDVSVVPGDHVAAAVAHERHTFLDGARRAGGLDDDVDALTVGAVADRLQRSSPTSRESKTWSAPMRRPARGAERDRPRQKWSTRPPAGRARSHTARRRRRPARARCRRDEARRARECAPPSAGRSRHRCSRRRSTASGSLAMPTPGSR